MRGDEETLTDYLDGRMASAGKAAFEIRLAAEPALERRLRLLRAMRASLKRGARAMPADLKAALKREARARATKGRWSWREAWRSFFGGSGVGCGLGAAFAAALLAFAVRLALPRAPGGFRCARGAARLERRGGVLRLEEPVDRR